MDLLLRQHPGKDLATLDDPVQESPVVVANQAERFAVAGECIVFVLHRVQQVLKRIWLIMCH